MTNYRALVTIGAVILMLSACGVRGDEKAPAPPPDRTPAAKTFVELLHKAEFDKATRDFDATMLKVMPADELKKTWQKLLDDAGAFKKQIGARRESSGKYDIVYVTCEFAKMKMDARVVFDKEGKISGLFFKKSPPSGVEEIYEGTLKAGPIEVRLVFHLFKQNASYAGTMDSPDQGAEGIVLDEVTVKDDAVRLELKMAKMVFEGKRSKDGKEIAGDLKQAGKSFPLTLQRVAKATKRRRPQTPKKPYPYEEIEVTYENRKDGIKLAGTLTVPRAKDGNKGPFPAVLLITGSGPQDRDETIFGHKPFLVLADYLTRRGIAVLRVDDRGVGGSTGSTMQSTTANFADDVRAGIEFLKSRTEIDAARIGLIGHSEGGIIAPLVASRSKDVAFIVLLAGTALPGEEVLYAQGAAILKTGELLGGGDFADLQKKLQERIFAIVRQEKDNAVAEKKLRAVMQEFAAKLDKDTKKLLPDVMPLVEGGIQTALTPWFRYFLDHDPRPALRKVSCPVLALNGGKDLQVDAQTHLKLIAAALKEAGNEDFTIRELPDLNHLFQTCKTGAISEYGAIEETIAPAVLEIIGDWLEKRTRQ